MTVLMEQDNMTAIAGGSRASESDRLIHRLRALDEPDSDFAAVISTMQSATGPRIEIPGGEVGLEKQMFESQPEDARSRNLAESQEEANTTEIRDPRALRFGRAQAPNNSPTQADNPSLLLHRNRPQGSIGHQTVHENSHSNGPIGAHDGVHSLGRPDGAGEMGPHPVSESRGPIDLSGVKGVVAHNQGVGGFGSVSAQNAAASVAGAGSVSPTTRLTAGASPAQHVGQMLRGSVGGEIESARSVAGPNSQHESRDLGQNRTQSHDQGRLSPKSNGTSDANRTGPGNRAAEPTPFDQLVRSIRLRASEKLSSARMQLDPPELGRMRVDVRVVGERAEIQVRTETPEAAYRIHDRAIELRSALEQHGIRVERFDIEVEPPALDDFSRGSQGSDHANVERGFDRPAHTRLRWGREQADDGSGSAWFDPDLAGLWESAQWFNVAERRVDVRV